MIHGDPFNVHLGAARQALFDTAGAAGGCRIKGGGTTMKVRMRRSVGGSFLVGLDGKSGYPNGVKAGDVVDLPDADVERYMHPDVALVEPVKGAPRY